MTDKQWQTLVDVVNGEMVDPIPVGFIIDSPWLPNWYGISILDYFSNDEFWYLANKKVLETFPEVMFFPGFWSEFGMCSEPSAFGARCSFPQNEFPHPHRWIHAVEEIGRITKPDPRTDGLGPLILNRLKVNRKRIEDTGHKIRFSISRGPLNIASYLMGTTEFLTALLANPDESHALLRVITDYLVEWHALQKNCFSDIDGIMILDDIIGFISREQFREFGIPYFKEIFEPDVTIKFLHNDADCKESIGCLREMGVNLFNMGYRTDLNQLKEDTHNQITMLGNIPPRDVLANGNPEDVMHSVWKVKNELKERSRVIMSCGGGMPPGVTTENIIAFIQAVQKKNPEKDWCGF